MSGEAGKHWTLYSWQNCLNRCRPVLYVLRVDETRESLSNQESRCFRLCSACQGLGSGFVEPVGQERKTIQTFVVR